MSERTTTTRRMETAGAGAVPRIGVRVSSLTISAPAPAWTIPLPIPVSMPTSLQRQLQALAASRRRRRRQQNRTGEQEGQVREQEDEEVPRAKVLVKDVSLEVEPGQVLGTSGHLSLSVFLALTLKNCAMHSYAWLVRQRQE